MELNRTHSASDHPVLIGLCPLLVKSTTLLTGLSMALAALIVLSLSVFITSYMRRYTPYKLRLVVILLISLSCASVLDMFMQAYWYEMRQVLGIYVPLLAMNSFILLSLEQSALCNSPGAALRQALGRVMHILCLLILLAGLRELFGSGSLFSDASLVFGNQYEEWRFIDGGYTLLLFAPGALIGAGLLFAVYQQLALKRQS